MSSEDWDGGGYKDGWVGRGGGFFDVALRHAWTKAMDDPNIGWDRLGTFVVSSNVAEWLVTETGEALAEQVGYGLPVREDSHLPPLTRETRRDGISVYVEAKGTSE